MVVKAADGVENGADDGDGVVLGRLALCEDDGDGVVLGRLALCEDAVKGSLLVVSSKEYFVLDLQP